MSDERLTRRYIKIYAHVCADTYAGNGQWYVRGKRRRKRRRKQRRKGGYFEMKGESKKAEVEQCE
jgi:hypothetical protein